MLLSFILGTSELLMLCESPLDVFSISYICHYLNPSWLQTHRLFSAFLTIPAWNPELDKTE